MKSKMHYIALMALLVLAMISMIPVESYAQCPMCRAAAETNLAQGGTEGKGLNTGILYMLSLPYLLIATIGYLWWRNNQKEESNA
ncbi:MAG: hypothetical protein P1U56_04415 [Saprospiraceae bacterium]|nr:hypothetical protein [Saprospiraceae bacterium]